LSTQPRGEVVAVPPTHRVAAPSKLPLPMLAGIVIGLAGLGVAAFFVLQPVAPQTRTLPDPNQPEVFAHNPNLEGRSRRPAAVAAVPVAAPLPAAAPPVAAAVPPRPAAAAHAAKPGPGAALPAEVTTDLDEAEITLAKGQVDEALHLARRTLTVHKSSRAFAIITRAYCRAGDLGNAKASFSSVASTDRAPVLAACKRQDIDLR
jgi:serine/threonine-protein kinase